MHKIITAFTQNQLIFHRDILLIESPPLLLSLTAKKTAAQNFKRIKMKNGFLLKL
jgi:hypothetical protein